MHALRKYYTHYSVIIRTMSRRDGLVDRSTIDDHVGYSEVTLIYLLDFN